MDVHVAAELLHLLVHHVHAHAPPGNLGDGRRRGEAGFEDELQQVLIGELRVLRHQAALDGLAAHRGQVDAPAVIGQGQDDVAAFTAQIQADHALGRFAGALAPGGVLDPVVDGVAQHVLQRRNDPLQHRAVQLAFGVVDAQLDRLVQFGADLAYHPVQSRHHALERHHAGLHEAFLQLGVDPRLLQQQGLGIAIALAQGVLQIQEVEADSNSARDSCCSWE